MNKKIYFALLSITLFLPAVSSAVLPNGLPPTLGALSFGVLMLVILGWIWTIFVGFAIIMFIMAAAMFFTAQGEPEGVKKASRAFLWGLIGMGAAVLAFSFPRLISITLTGGF